LHLQRQIGIPSGIDCGPTLPGVMLDRLVSPFSDAIEEQKTDYETLLFRRSNVGGANGQARAPQHTPWHGYERFAGGGSGEVGRAWTWL
jgi:hypothetical protein